VGVLGSGTAAAEAVPVIVLKLLHAKLGELTLEKDFRPARSARPAC